MAVAGERALFWPDERALFVADLHLEKASWYAGHGQPLPPYDSHATLEALAATASQTGARAIWCLGDNFHDDDGEARLDGPAADLLARLIRDHDWTWITGNHDAALGGRFGGRVVAEQALGPLMLRHEALANDPRPELSGHFHPRMAIYLRGRNVSRRCFVASPTKLILPAFGALTGGMAADDPAILAALGNPANPAALIPVGERLLRFPLGERAERTGAAFARFA